MPGIRTAAQAKAWLEQQGKSVQEFARENSIDPATTYQVLAGRKKGKRGEAHKVAVLLGMKVGSIPSGDEKSETVAD
ncbi:DNA-binding protein [Pseudomonas alliivorans]|uniref:DNA-binding protein n=1 Tax=Pseudomonas alliivorans TaxID=2810613 RepID=A0ABS4C3A4_9PSED|nr:MULTISPECIES: DNA-binding protein [Pseudomonas]MBP0943167.1 DNA-binding protein [Pseudomonas alliivorans]MBP0945114.1 DNA-binding protein [Pseudomonas alliivorans]MBP0948859.1 DNA-binding protein [Pseudomonas alliivorans]MCO5366890.1 DNA-binding protein [Pseudomonas alliivorans]MEE4307827.1 DNA-binding protein [Pseudomonas alliivorans]